MFRRRSFSTFCTSAPASMDDHEVRALFVLVKDMERKTWQKWSLLSCRMYPMNSRTPVRFPFRLTSHIRSRRCNDLLNTPFLHVQYIRNLLLQIFCSIFLNTPFGQMSLKRFSLQQNLFALIFLVLNNLLGYLVFIIMFLCKGICNPYIINYYFLRSKINNRWLGTNFI
jgi:hypothetical protein